MSSTSVFLPVGRTAAEGEKPASPEGTGAGSSFGDLLSALATGQPQAEAGMPGAVGLQAILAGNDGQNAGPTGKLLPPAMSGAVAAQIGAIDLAPATPVVIDVEAVLPGTVLAEGASVQPDRGQPLKLTIASPAPQLIPEALGPQAKPSAKDLAAPAADPETVDLGDDAAIAALTLGLPLPAAAPAPSVQPVAPAEHPSSPKARAAMPAPPLPPAVLAAAPDAPVARTAPGSVSITVRPLDSAAAPTPATSPAAIETLAAKPSKAARAASIDSALPAPNLASPTLSPAVSAPTEALPTMQAPLAASTAAVPAAPAPMDLNAVLDRLVAAREALAPVEAALDIRHAEFGEVSIRFEQDTTGILSVELSGADPELKHAVTAAVASERAPSAQTDSDSGRSAQSGQRNASATERDGTSSSSGREAQGRDERESLNRRAPGSVRSEPTQTSSRSGIFA